MTISLSVYKDGKLESIKSDNTSIKYMRPVGTDNMIGNNADNARLDQQEECGGARKGHFLM